MGLARTLAGRHTAVLQRDNDIVAAARDRLADSDLFRGRMSLIQLDDADGRLVIHGRLPSYYLKQVLQTTLAGIDGVSEIDNQVEVMWPSET